jgi:hypothetical protein
MALRFVLLFSAFLSLFWLPWPLAALLVFASALTLPAAAIGLGLLAEAVYGTGGLPAAFLLGALGTCIALWVRWFMKTRIMGT